MTYQRKMPKPLYHYVSRAHKLPINRYLLVTVDNNKKEWLHRLVWESFYGKIPKGMDIHHKDGDRKNNQIANLEMISKSEHGKMHRREQLERKGYDFSRR